MEKSQRNAIIFIGLLGALILCVVLWGALKPQPESGPTSPGVLPKFSGLFDKLRSARLPGPPVRTITADETIAVPAAKGTDGSATSITIRLADPGKVKYTDDASKGKCKLPDGVKETQEIDFPRDPNDWDLDGLPEAQKQRILKIKSKLGKYLEPDRNKGSIAVSICGGTLRLWCKRSDGAACEFHLE